MPVLYTLLSFIIDSFIGWSYPNVFRGYIWPELEFLNPCLNKVRLSVFYKDMMPMLQNVTNIYFFLNSRQEIDQDGRGAKKGGTGKPGSQKVNWPAESFGAKKIYC